MRVSEEESLRARREAGQALERIRRRGGMTQGELSKAIRFSVRQIARFERGEGSAPRAVELLDRILRGMKASWVDLALELQERSEKAGREVDNLESAARNRRDVESGIS